MPLLRLVRSFSPVLTILATLGGMTAYFVGEVQQAKAEAGAKAASIEHRVDSREERTEKQIELLRAEIQAVREEGRQNGAAQLRKWERVEQLLERLERKR